MHVRNKSLRFNFLPLVIVSVCLRLYNQNLTLSEDQNELSYLDEYDTYIFLFIYIQKFMRRKIFGIFGFLSFTLQKIQLEFLHYINKIIQGFFFQLIGCWAILNLHYFKSTKLNSNKFCRKMNRSYD